MSTLSAQSQLFLESLSAAGFDRDFNEPGFKLKNDLGVTIDEVLDVNGFTRSVETTNESGQIRTWINFRKADFNFEIDYRDQDERLAAGYEDEGYATISIK